LLTLRQPNTAANNLS